MGSDCESDEEVALCYVHSVMIPSDLESVVNKLGCWKKASDLFSLGNLYIGVENTFIFRIRT